MKTKELQEKAEFLYQMMNLRGIRKDVMAAIKTNIEKIYAVVDDRKKRYELTPEEDEQIREYNELMKRYQKSFEKKYKDDLSAANVDNRTEKIVIPKHLLKKWQERVDKGHNKYPKVKPAQERIKAISVIIEAEEDGIEYEKVSFGDNEVIPFNAREYELLEFMIK